MATVSDQNSDENPSLDGNIQFQEHSRPSSPPSIPCLTDADSEGAPPDPPTISAPIPPVPLRDYAAVLLHLSFNQDHTCFAAGTDRGFRVFNCDPYRQVFRRDFESAGGVGAVEMLFQSNMLALVGGGARPQFPPTKVMIWDDTQNRCIGELSYRSAVRSVRLHRDRMVVALEQKILVYSFADAKLLHQMETVSNPGGLCAVSQQQGSLVLVCPGYQKGQLRVEHYGTQRTKLITAHDTRIAALALSQDGLVVATASTKGTLVRIFSAHDGTLIQEVRRGADRADIYSIAFSPNMQWLAVSSDKGTIHVFSLKVNTGLTINDRPQILPGLNAPIISSSLLFFKGVLPKYFHSERSVARFRLREGYQSIVAFGRQAHTISVVCMDGSFYKCEFDPVAGGEMRQLECYNFLKEKL